MTPVFYLNNASITSRSFANASPWVANHFAVMLGRPELLVQAYVVP
jgi:hypothetical protein